MNTTPQREHWDGHPAELGDALGAVEDRADREGVGRDRAIRGGMMSQYVQLVKSIYAGVDAGDPSTLLAALAEDVEWNEAEHATYWPGRAFIGPNEVSNGVFARIGKDFDNFRVELKRVIPCGNDTVLVEGRYRATVRATGRELNAQVAHVWDFKDGKVVRWQQYTDTWQFAEVMGKQPSARLP